MSEKKILRARSKSRTPQRKVKPVLTENQKIKKQKKETYKNKTKDLIQFHKCLTRMSERYAKVTNHNHQLVFSHQGEMKVLTRYELAMAHNEYNKAIIYMNKLYVDGTKHSREAIVPHDFKSAYKPIKAGPVFVSFLTKPANFGPAPNEDGTALVPSSKLLDLLPRAREGYCLKNSLTLLMYIYAKVNPLKSKVKGEGQMNIPDDRMNTVFGKMEALYFQAPGEKKVLMSASGKKLSTFAVVSEKNSKFNPEKIENYFFQSLISLNYYENDHVSEKDVKQLSDPQFRKDLLKEYYIIEKANKLR